MRYRDMNVIRHHNAKHASDTTLGMPLRTSGHQSRSAPRQAEQTTADHTRSDPTARRNPSNSTVSDREARS